MDNMNGQNTNSFNSDNPKIDYFELNERLDWSKYNKPPQSKLVQILIALAKCAAYLFIWLGIQFVAVEVFAIIIYLQNINADPNLLMDFINDTVNKYSIELTIICNLLAMGVYFLIFRGKRKSLLKKIDISLPHKKSYLPTILLGFSGQFVTLLVLSVFINLNLFPQSWLDSFNQNSDIVTNANPVLSFFAVVILAPVFEELLCRGLILKTMRGVMPKWVSIILSAAIFGIVHGNPIQFIYATALGILLGWLYTKFDSIWIPMLCHLVFNLTSQLSGYLDTENMAVATILGLIIYASIPIFIFSIVYINVTKFEKKGDINNAQPFVPYQYDKNTQMSLTQCGPCPGAFDSLINKEYRDDVVKRIENDIENYNKNNKE